MMAHVAWSLNSVTLLTQHWPTFLLFPWVVKRSQHVGLRGIVGIALAHWVLGDHDHTRGFTYFQCSVTTDQWHSLDDHFAPTSEETAVYLVSEMLTCGDQKPGDFFLWAYPLLLNIFYYWISISISSFIFLQSLRKILYYKFVATLIFRFLLNWLKVCPIRQSPTWQRWQKRIFFGFFMFVSDWVEHAYNAVINWCRQGKSGREGELAHPSPCVQISRGHLS